MPDPEWSSVVSRSLYLVKRKKSTDDLSITSSEWSSLLDLESMIEHTAQVSKYSFLPARSIGSIESEVQALSHHIASVRIRDDQGRKFCVLVHTPSSSLLFNATPTSIFGDDRLDRWITHQPLLRDLLRLTL